MIVSLRGKTDNREIGSFSFQRKPKAQVVISSCRSLSVGAISLAPKGYDNNNFNTYKICHEK